MDWRNSEKAARSADKSAMEALSNTVETRLKASSHNRPPFNPALPVSKLNERAEVLAAAEKERETVLYAELGRQEKLAQLVKNFNNEATEMNNWANVKLEYLNTQTNIETLPQVHPTYLSFSSSTIFFSFIG